LHALSRVGVVRDPQVVVLHALVSSLDGLHGQAV